MSKIFILSIQSLGLFILPPKWTSQFFTNSPQGIRFFIDTLITGGVDLGISAQRWISYFKDYQEKEIIPDGETDNFETWIFKRLRKELDKVVPSIKMEGVTPKYRL